MEELKNKIRIIQLIAFAIITGPLLFLIVVLVMNLNMPENPDAALNFHYIVPILGMIALAGSRLVAKSILNKIDPNSALLHKLNRYQIAFIIRSAPLEGVSLLSTVAFFLSADISFAAISGVLILLIAMLFPTKSRIIHDLGLGPEERNQVLGV